jgi:hypothetical protein
MLPAVMPYLAMINMFSFGKLLLLRLQDSIGYGIEKLTHKRSQLFLTRSEWYLGQQLKLDLVILSNLEVK